MKQKNGFFKSILSIYWLLFCSLTPLFVCAIPIIAFEIRGSEYFIFGFILSFPIGCALALKMWDSNFISKHL